MMAIQDRINKFFKDKKVLVTGGAGFIGSHITETLIEVGAQVTILDNLSTGTVANLENVQNSINLIEGDVGRQEDTDKATPGQDIIFHLAASTSVPQSMEDPNGCYQNNVTGTYNVLQSAHKNNCQKLVFSSSSAVYGPQEEACFENMSCHPISMYGTSKLVGEQLCQSYATYFNLPTISLRYFNVFGARQNPEGPYAGVVAKFKEQMKNNKPVTIYGDGSQTRDFVPVEKVVEANLLLATLPPEHMMGQPVNIASNKNLNLLELFELLKQEYPSYNHPVQFAAERDSDIKHSQAVCTRFESLLQLMI